MKNPKIKISERDVMKAITDYLDAHHIWWQRNQSGATMASHGGKARMIRYGKKGAADLFVIIQKKPVAVEVKASGKTPSPEQFKWGEDYIKGGGVWAWFDSVDGFINWFTYSF